MKPVNNSASPPSKRPAPLHGGPVSPWPRRVRQLIRASAALAVTCALIAVVSVVSAGLCAHRHAETDVGKNDLPVHPFHRHVFETAIEIGSQRCVRAEFTQEILFGRFSVATFRQGRKILGENALTLYRMASPVETVA